MNDDLIQRLRNCNRADEAMALCKEAADALEGKQPQSGQAPRPPTQQAPQQQPASKPVGPMTTESASGIVKPPGAKP